MKRYDKYGRKASWIVKIYENYGRKLWKDIDIMVEREVEYRKDLENTEGNFEKDMENMEEK